MTEILINVRIILFHESAQDIYKPLTFLLSSMLLIDGILHFLPKKLFMAIMSDNAHSVIITGAHCLMP